MLEKSEQIDLLATALAKAQGEIEAASKDATNPHYKSKYADLASIWDAIREPLSKHGLSLVQMPYGAPEQKIGIHTVLMHASGQWIAGDLSMPVPQFTPQGIGSVITYLRRYTSAPMVGVVADDDDGESAMGRVAQQGTQARATELRERLVAPKSPTVDTETKARLEACDNLELLLDVWSRLSVEQKAVCEPIKNKVKDKLLAALPQ